MSSRFASFFRTLLVLAVCIAISASQGFGLMALQSVAWAQMLVAFSHESSLAGALEKTFDGEHPCKLCKEIAKAKGAEHRKAQQTGIAKTDLICKAAPDLFLPKQGKPGREALSLFHPARHEQPAGPPPRSASVEAGGNA